MSVRRVPASRIVAFAAGLPFLAAFVAFAGCATTPPPTGGAKAWCESIRASQLVPVFPLTEDLRPGDVFLVQTPLAEQARIWRERGFLAFDHHVARLEDPAFARMYRRGWFADDYAKAPHATSRSTPRAAFPTFTFTVGEWTGGDSFALPSKELPVSLAKLRTRRATATVAITDAHTYAADPEAIVAALDAWAQAPQARARLAEGVRQAGSALFLRVVTRVYGVGSVRVTLTNVDPDRSERREVVTFDEVFERPLVFGYVGFDIPVGSGGVLGSPIPTFQRLDGSVAPPQPQVDRLTHAETEFAIQTAALQALVAEEPARALRVVGEVIAAFPDAPEFDAARARLAGDDRPDPTRADAVDATVRDFVRAAWRFVSVGDGERFAEFSDAFVAAYRPLHGSL